MTIYRGLSSYDEACLPDERSPASDLSGLETKGWDRGNARQRGQHAPPARPRDCDFIQKLPVAVLERGRNGNAEPES